MTLGVSFTVSSATIRNRLLLIRNEIECQNEHYSGLAMSKTKTAVCPGLRVQQSTKSRVKGDSSFDEIETERKKSGHFFSQNTDILIDLPVL